MKKTLKASYFLSFLLVLMLSVFCVFQIIKLTEETYLLQSNQQKLNALSEENRSFLNETNDTSLRHVEHLARDMGFVNSREVSYIEILGTEVVVR